MLKDKHTVYNESTGNISESVFKNGDLYKIKKTINVPRSLVNAFVSKAKKEFGIDPRETWSDVDLVEMFVEYVEATFLNIDSLPVKEILGDVATTPNEESDIIDEPVQPDLDEPVQPVQPDIVQPIETQPLQSTTSEDEDEFTAQI